MSCFRYVNVANFLFYKTSNTFIKQVLRSLFLLLRILKFILIHFDIKYEYLQDIDLKNLSQKYNIRPFEIKLSRLSDEGIKFKIV